MVRPPAQEWETYRSGRLHDAAAFGDLACLDKLLSEGTDPNWANPATGLTPLLVASMNGRAECVLSLLRAGADIYAADSQGTTALELYVKLKTTCRSSSKVQPLTVPQPQPDLTSWIMLTHRLQCTPTGSGCAIGCFGAATTSTFSRTWRMPMPTASNALAGRCSTIRA